MHAEQGIGWIPTEHFEEFAQAAERQQHQCDGVLMVRRHDGHEKN